MKIIIIIIIIFICILTFLQPVHGLYFSEILYNPLGTDDGKEFIEIYGTDNLSDYLIKDLASNDTLSLLQYVPGNISIIVESNFNYSGLNCSVYSAGSTIGNNLNNGGDSLSLYTSNLTKLTQINYSDISEEGHSIELVNGLWGQSNDLGGTPCQINNSFENITITNQTNTSEPENNITNETINITPSNNCNISLSLEIEKIIYNNKEKITINNILSNSSIDYQIEYWIEDLFSEIVKKKIVTTNINPKSYTPPIKEHERGLKIINRLVNISCNNTNENTQNEKIVVVINPDYSGTECPKVEKTSCPSCPKCGVSQPISKSTTGTVNSFYTLAKNIGENVNVFSYVQGIGTYDLIITKEIQTKTTSLDGKKKFSFNLSVEHGNNTYYLNLVKENETVDFKKLTIERPIEKLKEVEKVEIIEQPINKGLPVVNITQSITGASVETIYESSNTQVTKYLKYGLVIVFILGSIVWLKNGKYKTKNRRRMGSRKNNVRNSWKTKRTHNKKSRKLHSSIEKS